MIHLSKNNLKDILEIDLQNEVYVIDNFLDEKFAEELYNYILWLDMQRTTSLKSNRYVISKVDLSKKVTPLAKWIDYLRDKNSIINKILQAKYKKKFYYIATECTNVYKYKFWDYQKLHLDIDSWYWFKELLDHNIGKDIWIHISLSKDWKLWDWWELVFYKNHNNKIIETQRCAPKFNQLWIYGVHNLYHEVLPVKNHDFHKITVTNWFHSLIKNYSYE